MRVSFTSELKIWSIFFVSIIVAVFLHEFGHCVAAWFYGVRAIPTPAKAYYQDNFPAHVGNVISLGGIIGTAIASLFAIALFLFSKFNLKLVVLAAALAYLGGYCIRFILKGRGHDSTEFQEAQAALGTTYSGHFVDWLFASLFIVGSITWFIRCKPGLKIIPRIIIGIIVSLLLLVELQDLNNKIFDPVFS
jgi:hypothetical protein